MATTRLYYVSGEGEEHLIEAGSVAQAIRHVTANRFSASVPSAKAVAELMGKGLKVVVAKAAPEPDGP